MVGYVPARLGWVPGLAPNELLSSWVGRTEAYFEAPGLLWDSLGCPPRRLDHDPPHQALFRLSELTGQQLQNLESQGISGRSALDAATPAVCPACLQEMEGDPQGLYLRRDWAQGLRTTCPRHGQPLVALPISGMGLFRWRAQGGCTFAHMVNQALACSRSHPEARAWRRLARFEAELITSLAGDGPAAVWAGSATAEEMAARLADLIPAWGRSRTRATLNVEQYVPRIFARSSRLQGPVSLETFGDQPPEIRRLFTAALMATRGATPDRRRSGLDPETTGGERAERTGPAGWGHPVPAAIDLTASGPQSPPGATCAPPPERNRIWYRQKAEALLASPAGQRALQLSGRARQKALGALMRRSLAATDPAPVS